MVPWCLGCAGTRFQIQEVDFKVISCFPPYGVTSPDTIFRCMNGTISALASVQKIHLLPTASSLSAVGGSTPSGCLICFSHLINFLFPYLESSAPVMCHFHFFPLSSCHTSFFFRFCLLSFLIKFQEFFLTSSLFVFVLPVSFPFCVFPFFAGGGGMLVSSCAPR